MSGKRISSQYDCAIIGAGPGGLVAALYLSRFKRKVLIVDAGHSRAQWIPRIRNLIGYGPGLDGLTLLKRLKKQVTRYKNDWIRGEAEVRAKGSGFEVRVNGQKITAQTVILATGMKDAQPEVSNIPELRRRAVLAYCPICDAYDHSDQKIGLIVKDNHGLKKIGFLSQFSKSLIIFQTHPFKVSSQNEKEMRRLCCGIVKGPIEWMKYCPRPKGLFIKSTDSDPVFVKVAYVALGVDFNLKTTRSLKNLKRTKDGHIITKSHQETSIPNLYAVGDCVNALAQVSVAIGQAALAATRIHNRLGRTIPTS